MEVLDVPVGDEQSRGISGGQRKRVNIALELASAPVALFLDEPTSGVNLSLFIRSFVLSFFRSFVLSFGNLLECAS